MNSSGKRRGLAVAATTALALSGLALMTPAHAANVQQNENLVLELYSQVYGGDIGVRNDGTDTTVTLAAASNNTDVNSYSFFYSTDAVVGNADDTLIDDQVNNLNGYGTTQWTPPTGALLDDIELVYVQAFDNADTQVGATQSAAISTTTVGDNDVVQLDGSNINSVPRPALGAWTNDPGNSGDATTILSGMSTDPSTTWFRVGGPREAAGERQAIEIGDATANGTPVGAVVPVNVSGGTENDTTDASDEIIAQARVAGESDDVQIYELYNQTITSVTHGFVPGFDPNVIGGTANDQTRYEIKVTDQNGKPIGGVDVYESDKFGAQLPTAPNACLGSHFGAARNIDNTPFGLGETGPTGSVTIRLNEDEIDPLLDLCQRDQDEDSSNDSHNTWVVVDRNENGVFDNGLDDLIELTQFRSLQAPANIEITSSRGTAMDADETTSLTFKVTDAGGTPIENAAITVNVVRDVADDDPVDSTTPLAVSNTNADGVSVVNGFLPGINNEKVDVTINATSGAAAGTLSIETDEAQLRWDNEPTAQALATTDTTQGGTLKLPSGTPLPDRAVEIDLAHSPGGNALFSPQAEQPAGTVRGGDTIADSTTNAAGEFSVKVDDPATPNGQELDDTLTADTTFTAARNLDLDWLRSLTPAEVWIFRGNNTTNDNDGLPGFNFAAGTFQMGTPGALGRGHVVVRNSDGVDLTDVDVQLTIDQGNFVDIDDPFEATPTPGAPVDFGSIGKSITVNTGDRNGRFWVNIERNAGFDDDGRVQDKVHAIVGSLSDTHDLLWRTDGIPVNPRANNPLEVELSNSQESKVLPKARAGNVEDIYGDAMPGNGSGQVVDYDVRTFDQFGNPTSQPITTTDNTPLAGFASTASSEFDLSQPAISAFAVAATDQTLEVELDGAVRTVYVDNPATSEFDPENPDDDLKTLTADVEQTTDAINWYDVDYDASSYDLENQGPGTVPVGSAVTFVLTARDQEGQPLENLFVDFLRGGPGTEDDDSCAEDFNNLCARTGDSGKAFYDFAGNSAGTANVSAIVWDDNFDERVAAVGPVTVVFSGKTARVHINALLGGKSSQGRDILKVNAPSVAKGAKVTLQKKVGNKWKKIGKVKRLDGAGDRQFGVKDRNGKRVTKYRAIVSGNSNIFRDATPVLRLR